MPGLLNVPRAGLPLRWLVLYARELDSLSVVFRYRLIIVQTSRPDWRIRRPPLLTSLHNWFRWRSTRRGSAWVLSWLWWKRARASWFSMRSDILLRSIRIELGGHRLGGRRQRPLSPSKLIHEVLNGLALRIHRNCCPRGYVITRARSAGRLRRNWLPLCLLRRWRARKGVEWRNEIEHRPPARRRRMRLLLLLRSLGSRCGICGRKGVVSVILGWLLRFRIDMRR